MQSQSAEIAMSVADGVRVDDSVTFSGLAVDVDNVMALIEKGQQLAGHFPSEEALDRARRVLVGEVTASEAEREILASHGLL